MKKHFSKELVITKEDNEDFENSTKCCIYDNDYIDGDVKITDHFNITRKCRGSAHRDCNINVKLNYQIPDAIPDLLCNKYNHCHNILRLFDVLLFFFSPQAK